MNDLSAASDSRPWYRHYWPWLLMLPPVLSIAGGVAMVWLATQTPSALVVEDYSRIEELTSERFARDSEASRLALTAELFVDSDADRVEVQLQAAPGATLPESLTLVLRHATDPAADLAVTLRRLGNRYAADLPVAPGRYHIELMPEERHWRLSAATGWLQETTVLRPQAGGI